MRGSAILIGGLAAAIVAVLLWVWAPWAMRRPAPEAPAAGPAASARASDIHIDLGGTDKTPEGAAPALSNATLSDRFEGEVLTLSARPLLYILGSAKVSDGSNKAALQRDYQTIRAFMAANGLVAAGPPIAITVAFDQAKQVWTFKAGIPLTQKPPSPPPAGSGIELGATFAGPVARFVHVGDPNQSQATYEHISEWLNRNGFAESGATWEEYLSDPSMPVSQWRTNIYVPIG